MPRTQAENTEEKESKGEKGYEPEGKSRFDRGRFIGYV
mgnify:CR=1 FL=1